MKIIINREFCQKIWKIHISHVKEPNRTRKMRELCYKMMHENHKKVNPRNRGKVQNGIRDFLKRTFRRVEKVDNLSKQIIFSETEFRKNNTMGWILQKENAMEIIFYDFVCPRELISHLWILIPGGLERGVKNNNRNFK